MTERPPHYPLFLDIAGRKVVVAGAGDVAERKIASLIRCGAAVTVVAPDAVDAVRELAARGAITWAERPFVPGDLEEALLVIAATSSSAVNREVADECRRRGILVNVTDERASCDFVVPAVVESGPIQLAISTGGRSPAVARRLRRELESVLGPEYEEMSDILDSLRDAARQTLASDGERKKFYERLLYGEAFDLLRARRLREAYNAVARECTASGVEISELVRGGVASDSRSTED